MTVTLALVVIFGVLALFGLVGYRAGRSGATTRDKYLTARGSQAAAPLGLSFFASGMGVWILFVPPEVGTFGGFLGIFGYGLGAAIPFILFAVIGPKIRRRVPEGVTLTDFVRLRFGRAMGLYVAVVSVFYMFIFITAELTAIGGVLGLVAGVNPLVPILAVAGITAAYTAYGGLPASLQTDRWQGWIILILVTLGVGIVLGNAPEAFQSARSAGLTSFTRVGAESLVVLVIGIGAANFFHQGYWQRIWSAQDEPNLIRGSWLGAAYTFPVVFLLGVMGMVAAGGGQLDVPSLAFFALLVDMPVWVLAGMVALAVALVASSVDTLQNGMVALVAQDLTGGRLRLLSARWLSILIIAPSVVIAVQGVSVLRLFLIANLLAAATIIPVLLGLWHRTRPAAALAGAISGLGGVVMLGWIRSGDFLEGVMLLTVPANEAGGLDLGAFLVAPIASGLIAWLGSLAFPIPQEAEAEVERAQPLGD